jgi:hypothetical protein
LEPALLVSVISACIAVGAALVSGINVWRTHFSPFRLLSTAGDLRLAVTREDDGFAMTLIVPITFANVGARVGRIRDARIDLRQAIPQDLADKYIYVQSELSDITSVDSLSDAHFPFWSAQFVTPKEPLSKALVFSHRSRYPIHGDELYFGLEIFADDDASWRSIGKWSTKALSPQVLDMLVQNPGAVFGMRPVDAPPRTRA